VPLELTPLETRVLGCLLEKERTTPEYYPLSLNGLVTACNQTTNRDPIVSYDEKRVEQGLDMLRQKKLAMLVHTAGARVAKYRHTLLDVYNLNPREVAILCVLMLRGAQTAGELRLRTERMCGSMGLPEMEKVLEDLGAGGEPLVRAVSARPGQKERRYIHLLSPASEPVEGPVRETPAETVAAKSRLDQLESELQGLKAELRSLRDDFEQLKRLLE
jgi:uncharacterized protein